jgi:hypothetical protein
MIIPEDKKYLLRDLYLNPQTSCSREAAVGILLGVFNINWWVTRAQLIDEEASDDYEFSLCDYLNDERGELQTAFVEAKLADAPEAELLGHLDKIEEFDTNYMKKAQIYWCAIADELSKGEQSELRTDEDGNITITSLNAWFKETSIFKQMQAKSPEAVDTGCDEVKGAGIKSVNVDFGILLGAFAAQFEKNTDKETAINFAIETAKKIDLEAVEVQKIAEIIHAILYEKGVSEETPKHKVGSIAGRLINAKRDALEYLNDPKNKC